MNCPKCNAEVEQLFSTVNGRMCRECKAIFDTPRTEEACRKEYGANTLIFLRRNYDRMMVPAQFARMLEIECSKSQVEKLQSAYDDAEEGLREIHMLCGNPDPADGEGTLPQEVVESVRSLAASREAEMLRLKLLEHLFDGEMTPAQVCETENCPTIQSAVHVMQQLIMFKNSASDLSSKYDDFKAEIEKLKRQLSDEQMFHASVTREYHELAVKNRQELDLNKSLLAGEIELAESLTQERDQLLSTFRHIHVNNGTDDTCKKCGLDLRHEIHERIVGVVGDWGFKDGEEYPK